jgi:hypothetical protein
MVRSEIPPRRKAELPRVEKNRPLHAWSITGSDHAWPITGTDHAWPITGVFG